MKKLASLLLCLALIVCTASIPAYAEERTVTIPLSNTFSYAVMADGTPSILPRISTGSTSISAYGKRYFYTSNGSGFIISSGKTVTVSLNLNRSATLQIGYTSSATGEVLATTISGSNPSGSFTIPQYGSYAIVIKNGTGSSVTINSGTITY